MRCSIFSLEVRGIRELLDLLSPRYQGTPPPYQYLSSPEPPHGWVHVLTHHLATAINRVGAKTETRREFRRLLASPTTGYWSNPPRRGGFPSGQGRLDYASLSQ
ncbi:hypothetical protein XU18_4296 [Perkinsela sp. CCAP 1560/4]|nr:hypothetical protein XU18_4296 [Perkinsela sp. CCAP 1560/4]|eukprot:KNH04437.1 hypothetical protein XU18_4296 [Perkinsela sp. CCAP 1560/4]